MAMKEIKITDFEGLQIGNAENTEAATGCTVLLFGKDGAPAGLDVRGGGPASRESELLKPMAAAQVIHAILLSGEVLSVWMLPGVYRSIWKNAALVLMSALLRCRLSASPTCLI